MLVGVVVHDAVLELRRQLVLAHHARHVQQLRLEDALVLVELVDHRRDVADDRREEEDADHHHDEREDRLVRRDGHVAVGEARHQPERPVDAVEVLNGVRRVEHRRGRRPRRRVEAVEDRAEHEVAARDGVREEHHHHELPQQPLEVDAHAEGVEEVLEQPAQLEHAQQPVGAADRDPPPHPQLQQQIDGQPGEHVHGEAARRQVAAHDLGRVEHLVVGGVGVADDELQRHVHVQQRVGRPVDGARHVGAHARHRRARAEGDAPDDDRVAVDGRQQLQRVPVLDPLPVGVDDQPLAALPQQRLEVRAQPGVDAAPALGLGLGILLRGRRRHALGERRPLRCGRHAASPATRGAPRGARHLPLLRTDGVGVGRAPEAHERAERGRAARLWVVGARPRR